MSAPILKLYGTVVVMFAVLIGFTSYWSVFAAEDLRNEPANHRDELQEQRIPRGTIRTADDAVIARSSKRSDGSYRRRYPLGDLFGHPIGYSFANLGTSGLEDFYDDRLVGRRTELVTVFESLLGRDQVGEDLETTLDQDAQQVATDGLAASASGKGAAVALDVETGAVRVIASVPGFDPNDLDEDGVFSRLANDEERTPLFNRATQGLFPPGSTFKAVTAAAALDTGEYTPGSTVDGNSGKEISGVPLENAGNQDFGVIDLTTALTNSVNTVWAEVGETLGGETMTEYMERFGFNEAPPIDLPASQLPRSGVRTEGKLLNASSSEVDVGRMAIGQEDLLVSPLQMATVAQTIANGGVRMEPYMVEKAFDEDGRTTLEHDPERAERAISEETAAALGEMMKNVVREGTGTAAALSGVEVAGKTGTAELDPAAGINDAWFIGFTEEHAVAVMVERVQSQGGVAAAPIAKSILEALGD
jgi:penicillin-binding protein A